MGHTYLNICLSDWHTIKRDSGGRGKKDNTDYNNRSKDNLINYPPFREQLTDLAIEIKTLYMSGELFF